jgi:hypothetical protein
MPQIDIPTGLVMGREDARSLVWMGRRYGRLGDPDIVFEAQTYCDGLMADLRLNVSRKQKGLFGALKEWVLPYKPKDYAGIIE